MVRSRLHPLKPSPLLPPLPCLPIYQYAYSLLFWIHAELFSCSCALGFDWSLHFKWDNLTPKEKKARRNTPIAPIRYVSESFIFLCLAVQPFHSISTIQVFFSHSAVHDICRTAYPLVFSAVWTGTVRNVFAWEVKIVLRFLRPRLVKRFIKLHWIKPVAFC